MSARIYRPSPSAMQSGPPRAVEWVLEFTPSSPVRPDSLMGWQGSADPLQATILKFPTQDAAVAFAQRQGYDFVVETPGVKHPVPPKNYSANFAADKPEFGRF